MKSIILICTKYDVDTRPYFNRFYGDYSVPEQWSKLHLCFNSDGTLVSIVNHCDAPDIIFLNDEARIDFNSAVREIEFEKLYVVHHESNQNNRINNSEFPGKTIWTISDHHNESGKHFKHLIEVSKYFNSNKEKYLEALQRIIRLFPHPVLESLIRLHKTASIILLKDGNKENGDYTKWLGSLGHEYELAKELQKNRGSEIQNIDSLLDWTTKKIPEISAKS